MPTLIEDLAPPAPAPDSPEAPQPPHALPEPDSGERAGGGEPPAPPLPIWRVIYEHPAFRSAVWIAAVLLALVAIGLLFPPNFWRF